VASLPPNGWIIRLRNGQEFIYAQVGKANYSGRPRVFVTQHVHADESFEQAWKEAGRPPAVQVAAVFERAKGKSYWMAPEWIEKNIAAKQNPRRILEQLTDSLTGDTKPWPHQWYYRILLEDGRGFQGADKIETLYEAAGKPKREDVVSWTLFSPGNVHRAGWQRTTEKHIPREKWPIDFNAMWDQIEAGRPTAPATLDIHGRRHDPLPSVMFKLPILPKPSGFPNPPKFPILPPLPIPNRPNVGEFR
jgi:hypothetical protein